MSLTTLGRVRVFGGGDLWVVPGLGIDPGRVPGFTPGGVPECKEECELLEEQASAASMAMLAAARALRDCRRVGCADLAALEAAYENAFAALTDIVDRLGIARDAGRCERPCHGTV